MSKVDRIIVLGAALCGIAMVVLSVWMLTRYPATADLTDGYRTPVLAFEFAQTPADLAFMTGDSDSAVRHRAAMAAEARQVAEDRFDNQKLLEKLERVIRETVAG